MSTPPSANSSLAQLFQSPELMLYSIDWKTRTAFLARMADGLKSYVSVPFHFRANFQGNGTELLECDLDSLLNLFDLEKPKARPVHMIFHMTAGASSLLCRCLEELGEVVIAKEPHSFTGLADQLKNQASDELNRLLRFQLKLYSRTFTPKGTPIIKTHHMCSHLLGDLMDSANGSGLYLYQDLESWLISVLKTPERRGAIPKALGSVREWHLARPIESSLLDSETLRKIDLSQLSQAEAAALFWIINLVSVERFRKFKSFEKLRTLRTDSFLGDPTKAIMRLAEHFQIESSPERVRQIAESDLFKTNAKYREKSFNMKNRAQEQEEARKALHSELTEGMDFARSTLETRDPDSLWPQNLT